jgi:uncharacterized protein (TIGR02594 family)
MHCFDDKGLHLMTLGRKRRATFLLCSVAFAVLTAPAVARPAHKAAHRHHAAQVAIQSANSGAGQDDRYTVVAAQPAAGEATQRRKHARLTQATPALRGFSSNSLVAEARKYVGTNPTGRGSLWCGAFMDLVLKRTGHAGGGNLASAYAHYGNRVSGPHVGAIAVMGRRGGGHVGVVTGVDPNGNPIILSGNHNHTVAESVYPRGRISAYVMPGG